MTENEAKLLDKLDELANDTEVDMYSVANLNFFFEESANTIRKLIEEIQSCRAIGTVEECLNSVNEAIDNHNLMVVYKTELEEYKSIGTIEECRVAVEKMKPKKAITYTDTNRADCPTCGATVRGIDKPFGNWCSKCGQAIAWSE